MTKLTREDFLDFLEHDYYFLSEYSRGELCYMDDYMTLEQEHGSESWCFEKEEDWDAFAIHNGCLLAWAKGEYNSAYEAKDALWSPSIDDATLVIFLLERADHAEQTYNYHH